MSKHPEWAVKHKKKGTELRFIKGKYYLYKVSSKRCPEKKRPQKITGQFLGRITEKDGLIESKTIRLKRELAEKEKELEQKKEELKEKERENEDIKKKQEEDKRKQEEAQSKKDIDNIQIKEYGITSFTEQNLDNYESMLKKHFPDHRKTIIILAYCKFAYQSKLKNIQYHYLNSYMSIKYPSLHLSGASLTNLLKDIGIRREQITGFFKEFNLPGGHILFDGTDLLSKSKKMTITKLSKSKKGTFEKLVNIMFAFSLELELPIYYRIVPGNIKDISSFKLCLKEANIKNVTVIVDKGFYSQSNINELTKEKLNYIVPLKRNDKKIDYRVIESGDRSKFDGFFRYEGRIIWYYSTKLDSQKIIVYLDEKTKSLEIEDCLDRVESGSQEDRKEKMETFYKKQHSYGTISLLNNLDKTPEEIYNDYKSRKKIEKMIETLKSTLDADKSYMQNEQSLEAWVLINFIAIHWYYKTYQILVKNKMLSKYSPMDIVKVLNDIKKVRINGKWHSSEITKETNGLLKKLGINIS